MCSTPDRPQVGKRASTLCSACSPELRAATEQGTPLAKDAWLLGIGLSFVIDAILSRGDDAS